MIVYRSIARSCLGRNLFIGTQKRFNSTGKFISFKDTEYLKKLYQDNEFFIKTCQKPKLEEDKDFLNNSNSLSNIQNIKTKEEIYLIYSSLSNWKKFFKFCVMFLNFYKKGLKDIWFNYKSLRKEVFNKYHIDNKIIVPGKKNAIAKVKIINNRNNKQLIKILNNTINNYKNEYRATNDFKKFFNNKYEISLKRSDFVKLLRTGKDIAKIPMFGLIFIIFEELTVLICYLFPSITPSTCILPQLSSRYYQSSKMAQNKLGKVVIKHQDQIQKDIIKYASRTPYTITEEELYPLIDLFKLRSPLIPLRFYSTETLRDNLQLKFQEILVDNFLILRDGGIWNLNKLELLDACINRGLINYDKLIKASRESNKSLYDSIDQNILRLRLFKFINDLNLVETTNVGYLSLNGCSMDMIDNIDPNKSLTFIRQTLVNNL